MSERVGIAAAPRFRWRATLALVVVAVASFSAIAVGTPAAHADPDAGVLCPSIDANRTLPDNGVNLGADREPFTVKTKRPFWSVAAIQAKNLDIDLGLNSSPANICNTLGYSAHDGSGSVDWIAVDNNRAPPGPYVVRPLYNTEALVFYSVQFVAGQDVLDTSTPGVPQKIGDRYEQSGWLVDIRDVKLVPGNTYYFTVTGQIAALYLLRSDAGDARTWTRTPDTATPVASLDDHGLPHPFDMGSVRVEEEGYYGALFVRDTASADPVTVAVETVPDSVRPGPLTS